MISLKLDLSKLEKKKLSHSRSKKLKENEDSENLKLVNKIDSKNSSQNKASLNASAQLVLGVDSLNLKSTKVDFLALKSTLIKNQNHTIFKSL